MKTVQLNSAVMRNVLEILVNLSHSSTDPDSLSKLASTYFLNEKYDVYSIQGIQLEKANKLQYEIVYYENGKYIHINKFGGETVSVIANYYYIKQFTNETTDQFNERLAQLMKVASEK